MVRFPLLVAFVLVALAAASCSSSDPLTPEAIATFLSDPAKPCRADAEICHEFGHDPSAFCEDEASTECQNVIATVRKAVQPTPFPGRDEVQRQMREVFLRDPTVSAMTQNRDFGTDYWIDLTPWSRPQHEEDGGWAILILAQPASWEGEVLHGQDTCRSGLDEDIDPDDPCIDKPRKFTTEHVRLDRVQILNATIDVLTERAFNLHSLDESPAGILDTVDYFANLYQTPCPAPPQPQPQACNPGPLP